MSIQYTFNISTFPGVNFWGIPKAGNTSIKFILISHYYPEAVKIPKDEYDTFVHDKKLLQNISPAEAFLNGKPNISFVRNPEDRFLSLYKDFSFTRRNIPGLFGKSVNDFINEIQSGLVNELRLNIHLRSMHFFLNSFQGEIFLIDNVQDVKKNARDIDVHLTQEQKTQIKNLWITDYQYYEVAKRNDISKFYDLLQ